MIYLDNAATTKVAPAVLRAMQQTESEHFYNTNTQYAAGMQAAAQVETARQIILAKLHGESGQLLFTSGATESNQIIFDLLIRRPEQNLIVTAGDHNSIYLPAKDLADRGFIVRTAPLNQDGQIDLAATQTLVDKNTRLLMFSLVNSDVVTLQDAAALVRAVRQVNPRVHIHADAAQAFAKFDFDVTAIDLDSVTICAHKIHGPKGVGALWLKKNINLPPRHGTLNNAGIVGFAAAVQDFHCPQIAKLHQTLIQNLPAGCRVNGINNNPYITNILLPNVYGETVMNALSSQGIYVGLGSACNAHAKGNRTLAAMKLSPTQQKQVLRVSFGRDNTVNEVQTFLQKLSAVLPTISGYHIL